MSAQPTLGVQPVFGIVVPDIKVLLAVAGTGPCQSGDDLNLGARLHRPVQPPALLQPHSLRRPDAAHRGDDKAILKKRHAVYEAAKAKRPERWSGKTQDREPIGAVTLNPERPV